MEAVPHLRRSWFGRNGAPRPVGSGLVVRPLTMPMTPTGLQPSTNMTRNISEEVEERAKKSYVERIRSNYETKDLGAIMSRFREAVSR